MPLNYIRVLPNPVIIKCYISIIQRLYKHHNQISFFQLTEGAPRKQAVSKFYSLLVLAKQEACKLHQSESFSDVFLQKGSKFESCLM